MDENRRGAYGKCISNSFKSNANCFSQLFILFCVLAPGLFLMKQHTDNERAAVLIKLVVLAPHSLFTCRLMSYVFKGKRKLKAENTLGIAFMI